LECSIFDRLYPKKSGLKGVKFETPFSKEIKTNKLMTNKPAINKIKSQEKLQKINKKRQENFGYINKEEWDKIREDKKAIEDKQFEANATLNPHLNDRFNANCKRVQERGTGQDWIKSNLVTVDDWVKIREQNEEDVVKKVEEVCPFKPKCETYYEVKV